MNKNESKYFNTARKMDEALVALLDQKELEYITVKDICEMAEVNRSTFYLHYETIQDLLAETLVMLNERFQSYYEDASGNMTTMILDMPLERLIFVCDQYLTPYLRFILDNKNVFAAAYHRSKIMESDKKYESIYQHVINPVMNRFRIPEEVRQYYSAFYMHGILAVIREWLKSGCKETPEEVSKIIENLVVGEKQISR